MSNLPNLLVSSTKRLKKLSVEELVDERYHKFRAMGEYIKCTEYTAFSNIKISSPTPIASAPPLEPSPITKLETNGVLRMERQSLLSTKVQK